MILQIVIFLNLLFGFNNTVKIVSKLGNIAMDKVNSANAAINGVQDNQVDILYWNSICGNDNPMKIEFGNETDIFNYWIPDLPLKVVVHGWLDSGTDEDGASYVKTAYVDVGGFNVITVDWGRLASTITYPLTASFSKDVGAIIARMLEKLVSFEIINVDNIHLIGHSLGAHIAGACGSSFKFGKIGRITGLDPAGPGFEYLQIDVPHLNYNDALFVDVIHTAAGVIGYSKSIGHVDFYPNGGKSPQPGCNQGRRPTNKLSAIHCSHSRAYLLYADTVYNRKSIVGIQCNSWENFQNGACNSGQMSYMGHDTTPNVRGDFYLITNDSSPYAYNEFRNVESQTNEL
ncbi:lipase member H-B-like isoform X1 [Daktulosphaira vitifoliae]|uniref:lipase member H-B-like isoform X1 n=1 Tax=Daktulosphaira vitifoliae TaxID=58002 RepID=UPI0021AA29C7|nr:lipase member H-B-like isoform X1 [Daktulosphaira vitifoliae]